MDDTLKKLLQDLQTGDTAARSAAAEELCLLETEAQPAAIALIEACADVDEEVREWANGALENLGPPQPDDCQRLATLLDNPNLTIGYWAATLLGRLAKEASPALEQLNAAVANSPHATVRKRATWAVDQISTKPTV